MCVSVYTRVCVEACVCIHYIACARTWMWTCTYAQLTAHVYTYVSSHAHEHIRMCNVYSCLCVHACVYMDKCVYTSVYIHGHTCIQVY